MTPEERADRLIRGGREDMTECDGEGEFVEVCSRCLLVTIRAAERDAAAKERGRLATLALLLDEWQRTPFFETRAEWEAWVSDFGGRVADALKRVGRALAEEEP